LSAELIKTHFFRLFFLVILPIFEKWQKMDTKIVNHFKRG